MNRIRTGNQFNYNHVKDDCGNCWGAKELGDWPANNNNLRFRGSDINNSTVIAFLYCNNKINWFLQPLCHSFIRPVQEEGATFDLLFIAICSFNLIENRNAIRAKYNNGQGACLQLLFLRVSSKRCSSFHFKVIAGDRAEHVDFIWCFTFTRPDFVLFHK